MLLAWRNNYENMGCMTKIKTLVLSNIKIAVYSNTVHSMTHCIIYMIIKYNINYFQHN